MTKALISGTLLAVLAAGCSTSSESDGISEERPTQATNEEHDFEDVGDPSEVFTQTLIVVKEDGTIETRSSTITRAEQWEIRRREREPENFSKSLRGLGVDWNSDVVPQHGWYGVAPGPWGICSGSDLLSLWDQENYVGNQLCFSYSAMWVFDYNINQWVQLFVPGQDLSTFSRGPVLVGCGAHSWWEGPRACVYTGGYWHWEYYPGLVTLQALSAKNNSSGAAIFSTHPGRNQGTNFQISAGTHLPSMFTTRRYLKALP